MNKQLRIYGLMLLTFISFLSVASCSKDDDENSETPFVETKVVVNDDGTTSNGSIFSAIDDKNFYLDYIKYTVEEGHLVVSGYDKTGFKGEANIVSSITYKQNTYEVLSIGNKAFESCKVLSEVTIPNSVTTIKEYAFCGCKYLTNITIPKNVISIGKYAFDSCERMEKIVVSKDNENYDSRDNCNAIIESKNNILLFGCRNTTIPNTVTSIESYAFYICTGLINITIPSSVTSIGNYAFFCCTRLTNITIPNSVKYIGESAFYGCEKLSRITIPNEITTIGKNTFYNCGLTNITIPNSVKYIGDNAFGSCDSLTEIHCLSTTPPTNSYESFGYNTHTYNKATLYVPKGTLNAYKITDWGRFKNIVEE